MVWSKQIGHALLRHEVIDSFNGCSVFERQEQGVQVKLDAWTQSSYTTNLVVQASDARRCDKRGIDTIAVRNESHFVTGTYSGCDDSIHKRRDVVCSNLFKTVVPVLI